MCAVFARNNLTHIKRKKGEHPMTTQANTTQGQASANSDSEQAAKLRRVLSVAEPKKPQEKQAPLATPKA